MDVKSDSFEFSLTEEKNYKNYNHGEEDSIPEPCQTAPDPQVENTLPSATTYKIIIRQSQFVTERSSGGLLTET